jgi:hypothetical protein
MENNPKDIVAGAILQTICLIIVGGTAIILLISNM